MTVVLARHGRAFATDRWYGRAWLIWPQAAALLTIGWLFTREQPPPEAAEATGDAHWAHAMRNSPAAINALVRLRDSARTDATARELLLTRAKTGDPAAEFFYATLFDPTQNPAAATPERTREALDWYRKAADQNIPAAMAALGILLSIDHHGIDPDYSQAFTLLERAAPSNPAAQRALGIMYRDGRGVPADVDKGMDLIRKAADRGDAGAEYFLADALEKGQFGLSKDPQQAVLLFQRAAEQNLVPAERQLAIHLLHGDGVEADREKANFWFRKAAAAGDPFSKAQLNQGRSPIDEFFSRFGNKGSSMQGIPGR